MNTFDDLVARRARPPLDRLTPLAGDALARLRAAHPQAPARYIDFLATLGCGELGAATFMLYGGLLTPDEVFGTIPGALRGVLLFGDDLAGTCYGFDTAQNWRIVEIDASRAVRAPVEQDFASFIRIRVAAAE